MGEEFKQPLARSGHEGPLAPFNLHGYNPQPKYSDDVIYMDIVMIITRSSILRQGSMGCLLVLPQTPSTDGVLAVLPCDNGSSTETQQISAINENNSSDLEIEKFDSNRIFNRIIAASTNSSLFQSDDSDVHAEINAIGQVAKMDRQPQSTSSSLPSITTQGATAYITMPPCKKCFGALHAAGITRIVSRRTASQILLDTAAKIGIEMVCLSEKDLQEQKMRLDKIFSNPASISGQTVVTTGDSGNQQHNTTDLSSEEVLRRRKQRKEEKRAKKKLKIEGAKQNE